MNFKYLKDFMDSMTDWIVPGNSVCVYHKNQEVFRYSSGYSDIKTKTPFTEDKFINLYSASKITTVIAAMQLVEKGVISLDDPLYKYIPSFKNMMVKQPNGCIKPAVKDITIENLFTMSAGLTYNYKTKGILKAKELTNGNMNTVVLAECMGEDPLAFEPGTNWGYSFCHDVLAAVVEIAANKKFSEYATENVFLPCGMTKTFYHLNDEIKSRMATQYMFVSKEKFDASAPLNGKVQDIAGELKEIGFDNLALGPMHDSGGAGVITTVSDYAKLGNALANFGVAATGERILTKSSVEELRCNRLNEEQMKTFSWAQFPGYGYGLGLRTLLDKEKSGSNGSLGEFGWGGAAGASMLIDPDREFSVFYAHHMLNLQESYYQPLLRNAAYKSLDE